jgi:L-lactate dehydrogenase (cytochrome)
VLHAIRLLSREIDVDLALLGCPSVAGLGHEFICPADSLVPGESRWGGVSSPEPLTEEFSAS